MISVQIPAIHDNSGKATSIRDACAAAVQEYKAVAPSLRQQWLRWMENRKTMHMEKEGGQGNMTRAAPKRASTIARQSTRDLRGPPQPEETQTEPEDSPLIQKRKTLLSQHVKEDVGEKMLFTRRRGTNRLTEYRSELPGSKLRDELDQAKQELQQESSESSDDGMQESVIEDEPQSLAEREGEMNEYLFTACATGIVHQWALDKQIQCDRFEVCS